MTSGGKRKAPAVFRVRSEGDLDKIPFVDGMAAVEIPSDLLDKIEFKHHDRGDSERLKALERSIRRNGYTPVEPITARIGRKGRWVVMNGGHRLTAARHVMREFWTNLFGRKVETLYFVLFLNPDSWSRTNMPEGIELPERWESAAQEEWARAQERMRQARGGAH